MANYRNQRIIPIILVVVIVIIAVASLVSLARAVFFSGSNTDTAIIDSSKEALLNTSIGHSVTMTVRGPIVADEQFKSYQIAISPEARTLTTYSGYLDAIVDQVKLTNNTAAYEQFVYALDKANLAEGRQFEGDRNDIRGICASGRVYEFNILDFNDSAKMLWTSTCRGSTGSLDANVEQLRGLFVAQIPDGEKLINKIDL